MKNAFTLIELLVVVTIIVILIALLLPAMEKAVDMAQRAVCATQIRGQSQTSLTYAVDDARRRLPDLHNATGAYGDNTAKYPWWYSRNRRDWMKKTYGVGRKFFYCPSNPFWNDDLYWNENGTSAFTGPGAVVLGYVYFGNNPWLSQPPTYVIWEPTPRAYPVLPMKLSDKVEFDILWLDLSRTKDDVFNGGGNHIEFDAKESPPPIMPRGTGGTNVGYRDGSTVWNEQNKMLRRFWFIDGGTYRFFW